MSKKQIDYYRLLLTILEENGRESIEKVVSDAIWEATGIRMDICNINILHQEKQFIFGFGRVEDNARIDIKLTSGQIYYPTYSGDDLIDINVSVIPSILHKKLLILERKYKIKKVLNS